MRLWIYVQIKSKLIELASEVLTEDELRRCMERRSAVGGGSVKVKAG